MDAEKVIESKKLGRGKTEIGRLGEDRGGGK